MEIPYYLFMCMSLHLQQIEPERNLLRAAWFGNNLEIHIMTCMQYPSHKLRTQGPKFAGRCHGEGHRMPQAKDQKKRRKKS